MASDALAAFLQRDFTRADQCLLTLASDSPMDMHNTRASNHDPRVKHNALVSKFYNASSSSHLDALIAYVAHFLPPDQRPSSVDLFFSKIVNDTSALKLLYSRVGPVALYNVAVIAYHQRRVEAAAALGDILFDNIEAMDEWLALTSCFLLTDVHLRLGRIQPALAVVAYAEKLLPSFSRLHSNTEASSQPSVRIRTLAPSWPGRDTAILELPSSYEHAKFCMHIYNARLSVASEGADSSRSIRKEAKSAVLAADDAHSRPTSAALLVKARVEQSFWKGLRILASIVNQCPPHMLSKVRPLALNSLGILHHRMGRHALAACYFEHSRRAFSQLFSQPKYSSADGERCLSVFGTVTDTHVAYNLALQLMKFGNFSRALELLSVCARTDYTLASRSPRLWLRMAECCIGATRSSTDSGCSLRVSGHGRGRRLIATSGAGDNLFYMEYAATCARAALDILGRAADASLSVEPRAKQANPLPMRESEKNEVSSAGVSDLCVSSEVPELKVAALSLIAYASLSFDPIAVIDACDEIHRIYPKSETEKSTLASLYAAEAFCRLGRPKEAAKRLAPLLSVSVPLESHVREAAYVNICLTHSCAGDLVTASRAARVALKLYTAGPKRPRTLRKEAIYSAAYVFLRNEEVDAARQALRLIHATPGQ